MDATISRSATAGLFPLRASGPGEGEGVPVSTPLRDSVLWRLQSLFYEHVGVKAWSDMVVPNFVTSNAFLAALYARLIMAFATDYASRPDAPQPCVLYAIEVGAGHGRFSFLLLRELSRLTPRCASVQVKYIMTDFTAGNVEYWSTHPRLAPYFATGALDSAVWDAETGSSMRCTHSGVVLQPGSVGTPIIAVCNYIFDTLKQDAFRIVEGALQEACAGVFTDKVEDSALLTTPTAAPLPVEPADVIRRMRVVWDYRPCTPDIYKSPALQLVLKSYTQRMRNAAVLVPVGGITAMASLAALSGGKLMLLVGDKAYTHEEELGSTHASEAAVGVQGHAAAARDPHVAVHGSFSFMVNLHAVRLYTLAKGGFSLHTPLMDGFKCAAFVLGVHPPAASPTAGVPTTPEQLLALADAVVTESTLTCPNLLCAWADAMDTFGPDNFSNLQRCVRDETATPSLKLALATLRLAMWDSDVFYKFKHIIIDATPKVSERLQADIARDMAEVRSRYYPLQPSKDVSFDMGRVFMGLRRYDDAIDAFRASRAECGDHHVCWYNEGICEWYRNNWAAAHACFTRSCEMRPDYTDAQTWKTRVEAKMAGMEFMKQSQQGEAPAGGDVAAATMVANGVDSGGVRTA